MVWAALHGPGWFLTIFSTSFFLNNLLNQKHGPGWFLRIFPTSFCQQFFLIKIMALAGSFSYFLLFWQFDESKAWPWWDQFSHFLQEIFEFYFELKSPYQRWVWRQKVSGLRWGGGWRAGKHLSSGPVDTSVISELFHFAFFFLFFT